MTGEQVRERDAEYWDSRYAAGHGSGVGSIKHGLAQKTKWLSGLPGIKSITDIGCGDFNVGCAICAAYPKATYAGLDISSEVIEINARRFETRRISFHEDRALFFDLSADLVLCLDVLFHISDDADYQRMLGRLAAGQWKHLAVTAYEYDGHRRDHVHIRRFDPSIFGAPRIREVIEADGEMMFYLWER